MLRVLGISCLFLVSAAASFASDYAVARVADAFDFPVGLHNPAGYYKSRGFRSGGHLGEDWNGLKGGNSDLGAPVYSVGNGVVVLARDARQNWGNVVIVRHAFYEGSQLSYVDSLYAHLDTISVREGQLVNRGQQVGTIGDNRGMYTAHLHFEIRKNLSVGVDHGSCAQDLSNYHDPTRFIETHRVLAKKNATARIALNTFDKRGTLPSSTGRAIVQVNQLPPVAEAPRQVARREPFKVRRYNDISSWH